LIPRERARIMTTSRRHDDGSAMRSRNENREPADAPSADPKGAER